MFLFIFLSLINPMQQTTPAIRQTQSIIMKTAFQPNDCDTAPRVYDVAVLPT